MKNNKIKIGVDVTGLIISNQVTGIERVMVETNKHLFDFLDPQVYEIHPFTTVPEIKSRVHIHPYLLSDPVFTKPLIDFNECDILFFGGINLSIPLKELFNLKQKKRTKIVVIIHDILPLTHPEWFSDPVTSNGRSIKLSGKNYFHIYLQAMFAISDQVILVSDQVKNDINLLGWNLKPKFAVVPLGAFNSQIEGIKSSTSGLNCVYVATIAPRKGHQELLDAFELLWEENFEITLTLVGNRGWEVEGLLNKIESHPMKNKKFFWKSNLVDSQVHEIYAASDIAFMVSEGEGFGLPLEEGLSKGLKVIARDIPVFRERNYPNLYFFSGGAQELSDKIKEVLVLPTKPLKPNEIRTMASFANDVAQIIKLL